MSEVYLRKATIAVDVEVPFNCGKCGREEIVSQVVQLDLLKVHGSRFDDSLRRNLIDLVWPDNWSTETGWYDESGGPGGTYTILVCPECQNKKGAAI